MAGKERRVEYIDLFRSFGIILMIMGHIKYGNHFDKWIHAFHMPMFFFVSGWFYRSREDVSVGVQIKKKVNSLLVPYLFFEIVQWLILLIYIPEYRNAQTLLHILTENTYKIPIESGTFGISPIPGAMWFLTAIFFIEAIYIVLNRILECSWKLHIAVVVLTVIGMLATIIFPFRLPWALDAAFVGIGVFHIARMIRKTKAKKVLNLKIWPSLMMGVIFTILIMVSPKINMRTGNYGWYLPFWINALGATVAGWNLSRYLEQFLNRFVPVIDRWLKNIGKNSIVYLCLNQLVILAVTKGLDLIGIEGFIAKVPILLFTIAILFGFGKLIGNTKLKVLIGK